jgi:hypothetical protein
LWLVLYSSKFNVVTGLGWGGVGVNILQLAFCCDRLYFDFFSNKELPFYNVFLCEHRLKSVIVEVVFRLAK